MSGAVPAALLVHTLLLEARALYRSADARRAPRTVLPLAVEEETGVSAGGPGPWLPAVLRPSHLRLHSAVSLPVLGATASSPSRVSVLEVQVRAVLPRTGVGGAGGEPRVSSWRENAYLRMTDSSGWYSDSGAWWVFLEND